MKKTAIIILLAVGLHAFAQTGVNLGIIPTPQRVEPGQGHYVPKPGHSYWYDAQKVKVDSVPAERNADQAYQIVVEKNHITVRYATAAGWNNACYTLRQLDKLYDTLPCMTITDWPAYRWRIWMDDISRGPVPHADFSRRQQEILNSLKFNAYTYYTEHTLYQEEFPDLAPAYVDVKRYPSLGACRLLNLQLFAHAEKTLRIPFYQNLMDSRYNFNPATEETYDFLRKRIAEAYRQLPDSPFFIINCDETEQMGTGRSKRLVDSLGSEQVYVNHINRCCKLLKEAAPTGGTPAPPVMWGDIVAKNPAMMRQLPEEMTYIMWAYEPLDSFKQLIAPFKRQGNPFWVAASTGHSGTMTSTPQRYIKNIANLFRDGFRDGADGAMLTCWDDNGEALFDNSWHAQYWAAEMAWNPLKSDDPAELRQREEQFNRNFERLWYTDSQSVANPQAGSLHTRLTDQLYAVGALAYEPAVGDWYNSAAPLEPLLNFNPDNTSYEMEARIDTVFSLLDGIRIDSAANPHAHYAVMRIRLTAEKARLRQIIDHTLIDPTMSDYCRNYAARYLQHLFDLKREYLRLWDQECGEYERYIVCNRYDALAREVLELDRHVFISVFSDTREDDHVGEFPVVGLRTLYRGRPIYYTLDGSEPDSTSDIFEWEFPLERSTTIKAVNYNEYGEGVVTTQYLLSHKGMGATIALKTPYSNYKSIYSGGGANALNDGQLGSNNTYADGHWQGYWGDSIDAVLDLGQPTSVQTVSMRFMQNTFDWILAPQNILVYTSDNGSDWTLQLNQAYSFDPRETGMQLRHCKMHLREGIRARYLRIVVPNPGPLPQWHPAPGQPSYLFTDEIVVD